MQLYCVQLNLQWEQKAANFQRAKALLRAANIPANSLILLPEMFATGFSMNVAQIAEPENGETHLFLASLARELQCAIIGGVVRPAASPIGRGTNRALAFAADGSLLADYAKLHPFSFGEEAKYYVAGEKIQTFHWQEFTIAPTICYDLRFPELYRRATQMGVQLLTVIANWPTLREAHWVALLQARAIENQCYVAGCNRTGTDPRNTYPGRSLIIDPHGKILADAGPDESLISAALSLPELLSYRQTFPALADLRPDLLPPVTHP